MILLSLFADAANIVAMTLFMLTLMKPDCVFTEPSIIFEISIAFIGIIIIDVLRTDSDDYKKSSDNDHMQDSKRKRL